MARTGILLCTAVCLVGIVPAASALHAADDSQVRWFNDVNEAWQKSKAQGRPLLIFVTRAGCLPCAKMKASTYTDSAVAAKINERFVPLTINADRPSELLEDLAVTAFPVTFVISPDAVILERMDGFIPPEKMAARLSQVAKTQERPLTQPVSGKPSF